VVEVVTGSPAHQAGIRPGDIIVGADGEPLLDVSDLQRLLTGDRVGESLEITVVRGKAVTTIPTRPMELGAGD
jgi:S1-C subfamily serine protease